MRVLAATNRELQAEVIAGTFRKDLFYRLNVFPIRVPSLAERVDDIPLLVEYYVDRYGKKAGKKYKAINKETLELFEIYDWPGNIRELQNVIERAVVLCDDSTLWVDPSWLKSDSASLTSQGIPFETELTKREREMIEAALAQSGGPGIRPNRRSGEAGNSAADARLENQEPGNRQASVHKSIHLTPFIVSGLASFRLSPFSPPSTQSDRISHTDDSPVLSTFQQMLKIRQPLPRQSQIVQVVIIGILLASPLYRTDHR